MDRLLEDKRVRAAILGALASVASLSALRVHGDYARTLVWSALMLASFTGWGSLVGLWLAPGRRADWGLRAGWGMAFSILTGGYLCLFHLAGRPVFIAQVVLGVGCLVGIVAMGDSPWFRPHALTHARRVGLVALSRPGLLVVIGGAYLLALCWLLGYMGHQVFQASDDPPLYFLLAQKLMQTGSLLEPFNQRRIATLGGQQYLHASFLSVAPTYFLHVVDAGISLIVLVALLIGQIARPRLRAWHGGPLALTLLLLFALTDTRVNTAAVFSAFALCVTLFRTVQFRADSGPDRPTWPMEWRRVLMLGVVTAACVALRTSVIAALLPFICLVVASDWALGSRRLWTRASLLSFVTVLGLLALGFVFALLPWSILLKQSCGTFFYPLGHSNLTPGFVFMKGTTEPDEIIAALVSFLFWERPICVLVPFLVVGLLPIKGRARNDLALLTLATMIGMYTLAKQASLFETVNMPRYYGPYVVALALMACASVARLDARAALIAAGVAMHIASMREIIHHQYDDLVRDAHTAWAETAKIRDTFTQPTKDYLEVQSYLPAGARAATAVHEPFRFDFRRNELFTLDLLGGMGPAPGWPTKKGGAALGDYFRDNGIRYLVYVDFGLPSEFYNREHWRGHLSKTTSYLGGEAPFQLDGMDAIEELAKLHHTLHQAHGMTVVDLQSAP